MFLNNFFKEMFFLLLFDLYDLLNTIHTRISRIFLHDIILRGFWFNVPNIFPEFFFFHLLDFLLQSLNLLKFLYKYLLITLHTVYMSSHPHTELHSETNWLTTIPPSYESLKVIE